MEFCEFQSHYAHKHRKTIVKFPLYHVVFYEFRDIFNQNRIINTKKEQKICFVQFFLLTLQRIDIQQSESNNHQNKPL
jgi:hypothetical protein